ncbi:MAG: ATP-binding cassette domain-containing protein [Chloroflexota bacterium]|nr:ATP-binding cassette domain-containing protein [Chloroflexota bacterium]
MIKALGLAKHFKELAAVDEVSFTCHDGEVFGLLGPNGAGKTTLLRLLATILEPTAGTAMVDGLDVRQESAQVRARIGLLVETAGLYARFTPREHLRFYGHLHGLDGPELEQRVSVVLEILEMADFADRRAEGFSAGMNRRVILGQALIHDPPNVILDEPTAGLDVMSTRNVRSLITRFRDAGRCVLISTHLMSEAQRMCDRVAIIHRGHLQAVGTPAALIAQTGAVDLEEAFVRIVGEERLQADLWEQKQQRRWYQFWRREQPEDRTGA